MNSHEFKDTFSSLVLSNLQHLLDLKLSIMKQAIHDGWDGFYSKEMILEAILPAPIINDKGRAYLHHQMRLAIVNQSILTKDMAALHNMSASAQEKNDINQSKAYMANFEGDINFAGRKGYRNYLAIKNANDLGFDNEKSNYDLVAIETIKALLTKHHRHFEIEANHYASDWLWENQHRAVETPSFHQVKFPVKDIVRNESVPLIEDYNYWHAYYENKNNYPALVAGDAQKDQKTVWATRNSEWTVKLMAVLADDFEYNKQISRASLLVFEKALNNQAVWLLVFSKDGGPFFHYPPTIYLYRKTADKQFKAESVLFTYSIDERRGLGPIGSSARGCEIELQFYLPQLRAYIKFFTPLALQAMPLTGTRNESSGRST